MEGFIVFIIIAVIISSIVSAAKGAKKTGGGYRPPQHHQPPQNTQLFDMDADSNLQGAYWHADTAQPPVQQQDSMEMQAEQEMVHSCEDEPEDTAPHDFDPLEERRIDSGLSRLEDLTQLNDDLQHKKEQANAYDLSDYTANQLRLFHDRSEVVKALIYSEVMQPKFRSGRQR